MPHPSHQHTHIQHGLLKGLIHYVVNSLPSATLSASSSQHQRSLMPRQQLPPHPSAWSRPNGRAQGQGHREGKGGLKAGGSGASLADLLRAGNQGGYMEVQSAYSFPVGPNLRQPMCVLWTCNSHLSVQPCKHTRGQHAQHGRGKGAQRPPWLPGHTAAGPQKATASLIYRVRARNQSGPQGGRPLQPGQSSETQEECLKGRGHSQGCRLAAHCGPKHGLTPSTTIVTFGNHSKPGVCLSFPERDAEAQQSQQTWQRKSRASHVWILDHWCQSFSCSICSILPLSLKIDTLLVPTTDSQFWEDLS